MIAIFIYCKTETLSVLLHVKNIYINLDFREELLLIFDMIFL